MTHAERSNNQCNPTEKIAKKPNRLMKILALAALAPGLSCLAVSGVTGALMYSGHMEMYKENNDAGVSLGESWISVNNDPDRYFITTSAKGMDAIQTIYINKHPELFNPESTIVSITRPHVFENGGMDMQICELKATGLRCEP